MARRGSVRGRDRVGEAKRAEMVSAPADPQFLDDYVDWLYEDEDEMVRGTQKILELCWDVQNLEMLVQNTTAMGALSRTLKENMASRELCYNIVRIFLALSSFMEMHSYLRTHQAGALTMQVVKFELKDRLKVLQDDVDNASSPAKLRVARANLEETIRKQNRLLFACFYVLLNVAEEPEVERKMVNKKLIKLLVAMLERRSANLLVLTVTFLKKLSIYEENVLAMQKAGVVAKVARLIGCDNFQVVDICLRFLFNLSFDADLRQEMVENSLVPKLVDLLQTAQYRARTLKLLYHLSVDDRCKTLFAYTGAIPVILGLVVNFPHNKLPDEIAGPAVNISLNPRNAELLAQNHGLNHLVGRLVHTKDPLVAKVVRNISQWSMGLQNSATDPETEYKYRGLWAPHVKPLLAVASRTDVHDLLVELVGTLANLTPLDMPPSKSWAALIEDYDLINFVSKLLVPGMAQNDVILETIMFVSTLLMDPEVPGMIVPSNLIRLAGQIWEDKGEDTEILLQLLHVFARLLSYEETADELMFGESSGGGPGGSRRGVDYHDARGRGRGGGRGGGLQGDRDDMDGGGGGGRSSRLVIEILDALQHRNKAVRRMADSCLELMQDRTRDHEFGHLTELGMQIVNRRFSAYNREWLHVLEEEDEDEMAHHQQYRAGGAVTGVATGGMTDPPDMVTGNGYYGEAQVVHAVAYDPDTSHIDMSNVSYLDDTGDPVSIDRNVHW